MPAEVAVANRWMVVAVALALAPAAPGEEPAGAGRSPRTPEGDQYLAAPEVRVTGAVDGDLIAAGATVTVTGEVRGDLVAAAGRVEVAGRVSDDVRVAGGQVHVRGEVGDEVLAAGGEVVLHRGSAVGGKATLAGRNVVAAGSVRKDLRVGAERVELDGEVGGTAGIVAERVVVGPRARIAGDLVVRSREAPLIDPGAQVGGRVVRLPPRDGGLGGLLGTVLRAVAFQLGLLVLAWAWLVLVPGVSREAVRVERQEPGVSLGFGVGVLFGLPAAALALTITFVGIPLALAALATWGLAMLAGYASTAVCLGDWLRQRMGQGDDRLGPRLLGTAVALAALRALEAVPWLGVAVAAGALVLGAGAVGRAVQLAWARARAARGLPPAGVPAPAPEGPPQ
jgi:cytoskeletal protein CcmA (bactofilin family)